MKPAGIRCHALTRSLTVLVFILDQPRTLAEIAAETGVCVRTVRRDLEVLQRVGMPITADYNDQEARWGCLPSRLALRVTSLRSVA